MTKWVREKATGYKFLYNEQTAPILERQERDWELYDDEADKPAAPPVETKPAPAQAPRPQPQPHGKNWKR